MQNKMIKFQDMVKEKRTNVTSFISGLSFSKHLIKVLFNLSFPFEKLIDEHNAQSHSNYVFPRIYNITIRINQTKEREFENEINEKLEKKMNYGACKGVCGER
jgi:hypothetical protein